MAQGPEPGTLAGIALLKDLTVGERQRVEKLCRWRRYGAEEQIIDREGDSSDLCFVVEGRVRVVNYSASGREITLDDIVAGEYFGELAAIDGRPRSANVMSLTPTLIATLTRAQFRELVETHPKLGYSVMERLASMVRHSTERIMNLSTLAANNRVFAELLREARASMSGPNEASISPIPVHGQLASRVSTTRETVARVLGDLTRQGIVVRTKNALVVKDVARLARMAETVRGE
ncbi:MAG: Crp/Fnr family transcriptional regulator [Rhodospirillales bacterium]|nr:Crp/Fnr family transcriptional regulator [Rhodospirillales bacterium]